MKKLLLSLVAIATLSLSSFGQVPEGFKYQAVVRDAGNIILNNQAVGMRLTIQQGSIGGITAYSETFSTTTNGYGLVNLEIGTGTTAYDFTTIDWANGPYFMETAIDATGGSSYVVMGTSQLMSVPYALYAKTSGNGQGPVGGFTHYLGEDFNGGIIYYLYKGSDGLEHGLIVSKTESTAAWQASGVLVNANRTWDGAFNTPLMTNSAAATYIATLGAGWYLPSIDELSLLWQSRFTTNKALNTGGFTLLSPTAAYWSSTETNATGAFTFYFFDGYAANYSKNLTFSVRGVRAF